MSLGSLCNLSTSFSLVGVQLGQLHNSAKALPRQSRLLFGHSGFCCESSFFTKQFGNHKNTLFAVQNNAHNGKLMAASGSLAASGDLIVDNILTNCGNVSNFAKSTTVHIGDRIRCRSFPKTSMSMRSREPYNNWQMVHGYFIFGLMQSPCNSNPVSSSSRNYSASSSPFYSDGTIPDMTLNGLSCDEHLAAISADQNDVGDRNLKLLSGSCYLPHPDKVETGGEDAHFICVNDVVGVADGVGGWADVGVNAGLYARELMSNSVSAILDEPKGCIDPARVLDKAHSITKAKGSSTACILALTDQGIHAINLGDSGFIIVRDGYTIFQSPVQQHGFNFPYQLESGCGSDQPSSGQVFTVPVVPGDVIVAGTDGLFDNLYDNEVATIVVNEVRAGLNPEAVAQKIAVLARERAEDRKTRTPFSTAAQDAGFHYYGGKLDDITVVVSYVSSSTNQ